MNRNFAVFRYFMMIFIFLCALFFIRWIALDSLKSKLFHIPEDPVFSTRGNIRVSLKPLPVLFLVWQKLFLESRILLWVLQSVSFWYSSRYPFYPYPNPYPIRLDSSQESTLEYSNTKLNPSYDYPTPSFNRDLYK